VGGTKSRVIILGAGRPYRGDKPSALLHTSTNKRVLDWTIEAFNQVMQAEIHYVGGYHFDEVIRAYPDICISVNPNWARQGSLGSLLVAPLSPDQTTYICYADIVITSGTVQLLSESEGDVVLVADRDWRHRYESRSRDDLGSAEKLRIVQGQVVDMDPNLPVEEADAEYIGLLKLSPPVVNLLIELAKCKRQILAPHGIPRLIREFKAAGLTIRPVEIKGGWAELNAPQDLARFILGTKANTLERLRPLVRHSRIGEQVTCTVGKWQTNRHKMLKGIRERFGDRALIVRSSALTEDGWTNSNAGSFTSLLNVPGANPSRLTAAIDAVVQSYGDGNLEHQILVQAMLADVVMHGVVLTRTLNHGAPYYTLNYDDTSSNTETVTSGLGRHLKTLIVHRGQNILPQGVAPRIYRVFEAIWELEDLVRHDSLDVEFAVTADETVNVLQLRPIAVDPGCNQVEDATVDHTLQNALQLFRKKQRPSPFVLGARTIFGVMPDWNPAEIIGTRPRRLAVSLYQYLVTDEVWATQRAEYGYRDVRPHPLQVTFAGCPYIDVRACFNSFIPATVPDNLAERLVDRYLELLSAQPHLHDKVEFRVALTCLTFDFYEQARGILGDKFSESDLATLHDGLAKITQEAPGRCLEQLNQISFLEQRFEKLAEAALDPLSKAYALIEDCRRYGTPPFAHLARAAFIASSLLHSLERIAVTTSEQTESFLKSLNTVASMFERDGLKVAEGRLGWQEFVRRYGHLRPGTYEITSLSYAEDPEKYLRPMLKASTTTFEESPTDPWNEETRSGIEQALRSLALPWHVDTFEGFLRQAIEWREYSKFVFSRNLSAALNELIRFAASVGVDRNQLSHVTIQDLLSLQTGLPVGDVGSWLAERAKEGEMWHRATQGVELPALLINQDDLFSFYRHQSQPNFVTRDRVVAEPVNLANSTTPQTDLRDKIVLIPQADPGYDWLFGHNIAGLITMYGGANSHMTIRAAEFGLPAAIGVGESLYHQLASAHVIDLDCSANCIRVVG